MCRAGRKQVADIAGGGRYWEVSLSLDRQGALAPLRDVRDGEDRDRVPR